jgi:magnesium transporter
MVSVNKKLLTLTERVIAEVHHDTHSNPFIQDLKDLTLKLHSNYEQIHEDVSNLLNIYISISAHKTNEVMKVLTIFSVFFMPLTFIAGIYGMNFKYMPELDQVWGYPASLGLMLVIIVVIYVWFKRKKWM